MRLTQIRLDAGHIINETSVKEIMKEENCTREEAFSISLNRNRVSRVLSQYGGCWNFTFQTNGITFLFENLLGRGFKNEDTQIIVIHLLDIIPDDNIKASIFHGFRDDFDGFTHVQLQFDYDKFFTLSDYEKKKETLDTIMAGIRKVGTKKDWNIQQFEEVYKKIVELDYKNEEWKDKKIAHHPTRKLRARLFVNHDVQAIEIYVIVTDYRKKELYREKIITVTSKDSTSPAVMVSYNNYELTWKKENQVALSKIIPEYRLKDKNLAEEYLQNKEETLKTKGSYWITWSEKVLKEFNEECLTTELAVAIVPNDILSQAPQLKEGDIEKRMAKQSIKNIKKFALDLHYEIYNKIYDSREDNYDTIQQGMVEAFKNLFIKINKAGKEVGYINISLLRHSIKNGGCLLLMSASNSTWFLDKNPVEIYYDCSWLLKFLHEYEEKLNVEAKKYVGKITKTDVEILKWESLDRDYKGFLTPMFRNSIEKVIELEEYKALKKATNFRILIGEHKDMSEPIWVENNSLISATELKYNIKNKNDSVTGYNHYKDLDLSEDTYSYANLMYT